MPLVTIRDLSVGFRGPPLLDGVNCQIGRGQRIGLLGRNGAGKTTFMRILLGEVEPDAGEVLLAPLTRSSFLPQEVPRDVAGSVRTVVEAGWQAPADAEHADDEFDLQWKQQRAVAQILSRLQLEGEVPFETLSAGMKRRVLLARSLVATPDLLLLDEPTNHMDIEAIMWLENFLQRWSGTLIFVTHDRAFLRHLADRILEIDRGRLFDWTCDYTTFLHRKAAALEAEEKQNALFDARLAQEEVWIRKGIEARRTRNEGRVRALLDMRRQRQARRTAPGKVSMRLDEGQRSGQLVIDAEKISFAYGQHTIVRDFSTTILHGDKVGIMGPNGAGKTTLLRLLLGHLAPQQGRVRLGTNLHIAYFDQLRAQLQDDLTVQDNVSDGSDSVHVGRKPQHVIGYLQDFLFSSERARTPVRFLSGGERNRVLLAKLFAKPANVIVLDEPTNDLDAETVELLEERLGQYRGTVLLISHDREFLNNVVSSTIVFEPHGVHEYVGGFDDWLRQRPDPASRPAPGSGAKTTGNAQGGPAPSSPAVTKPERRRLTYKEQQELAGLPGIIEQLEAELSRLHADMAQPDFYKRPGDLIAADQARLRQLDDQLASAYQRWEELES